jgi:aldehyde:ferredoxin oxidoreductase
VISETFRHFGRLGLGAVFGKKLKGLVIGGHRSCPSPTGELTVQFMMSSSKPPPNHL